MSDFNQLVIEKSIEHWPVFAGLFGMLFAMWRWVIPNSVKSSLENGGGDAVRKVMKSELIAQDTRLEEKLHVQMKDAFETHGELTDANIKNATMKVQVELEKTDERIIRKLNEIDSRTGHIERKLKMKRRRPLPGNTTDRE